MAINREVIKVRCKYINICSFADTIKCPNVDLGCLLLEQSTSLKINIKEKKC